MENNKNAKRLVLFVTILMLFTLMNANVTKVLASNKPTVTPTLFDDGNGNKQNETHEANTSVWKYANGKHWNPCKVSGCTDETHKWNEANHSGSATCTSRAYCSTCKIYWGSTVGHQVGSDLSYYPLDKNEHYKKCKWYDTCGVKLNVSTHKYDGTDDTHTCRAFGCGYVSTEEPHHGFLSTKGYKCENPKCTAMLNASPKGEILSLPIQTQYYMIGSGHDDWEKDINTVEISVDLTPYCYQNSDQIMEATLTIEEFKHGNYEDHVGKLYSSLSSGGYGVKDIVELTEATVSDITSPYGAWKRRGTKWLGSNKEQNIVRNLFKWGI